MFPKTVTIDLIAIDLGDRTIVAEITLRACPVQIEGEIDGVPFYFRARGTGWEFGIGDNPVAVVCEEEPGFLRRGDYINPEIPSTFPASWMPHDKAASIIQECITEYLEEE